MGTEISSESKVNKDRKQTFFKWILKYDHKFNQF